MRRWSLLLAVLVAASLAAPGAAAGPDGPRTVPEPQIVGGTDAPAGLYPFAAALVAGSQYCGAAILDSTWLLTAAHCEALPGDSVAVGKTDLSGGGGQTRIVKTFTAHPDYDDFLLHNDVALVELTSPITLSLDPVVLAGASNRAQWAPGVAAQILGWGATNPDGTGDTDKLQHASVPIISDAACATTATGVFFDLEGAMLCAGVLAGGTDSCFGDSGGPLVVPSGPDWIEAGIVSFGGPSGLCAQPNEPAVYTEVAVFRSWIAQVRGAVNQPPVLADDPVMLLEDAGAVADLFANDVDPEDELLRVDKALVQGVTNGVLSDNLDGTWTYDPDPHFFGTDTFTYDVIDSAGALSNTATVTVTVQPVNDPPTFTPGGDVTVAEDSGTYSQQWATNISVGPANESGQGRSFAITANTNPSLFATAPALNSSGVLTFRPAPSRTGTATISLVLRDTGGTANGGDDTSVTRQFRITVTPVNDRPVANDDSALVADGGSVVIPVLANDTDPEGDPLTAQIVTQPARGTATVVAGGTRIRYDHDGRGPGSDSFTYRASDGSLTSTPATVSILVDERDSDGVPAEVEDGAPNRGDGNADGIPDADQSHVASLPNVVDGTYVTLVGPKRSSFVAVTALPPQGTPPAGVEFPVGMFSWEATGLLVGEPARFTMILHGGFEPDTFFKYGPTRADRTQHYYEFRFDPRLGPTGAALAGNEVVLHLIDGEDGDEDLTHNGIIGDPGGPARIQHAADRVGLVDGEAVWHLRTPTGAVRRLLYGNPGDVPLMGDWDCDGIDTPGLYRQADGFVYLRNSNTTGVAVIRFFFGDRDDVPLAGDWNGDGCDTISLYRPSEQRFFIINALGANDGGLGEADFAFTFGDPGDRPFAGDLDGDGFDEVGLHRPGTGLVYYRTTLTSGFAHRVFIWGNPADVVFAGDWTADGTDTVGLFRPSDGRFYLRHVNKAGVADEVIRIEEPDDLARLGKQPWRPVAGVFS